MPRQLPVFYEGDLGQYFRELRASHGWSTRQAVLIAEQRRLPVRLGALRWLEGGLTKNPDPELLRALSVLYDEPYENIVREVTTHVFGIKPSGSAPAPSVEGFITLPLLAIPIAAGLALRLTLDREHDKSLAFRKDFAKQFTRPVCLRVGRREAAMVPTIQPGDVVVVDQDITRRRRPQARHIYAVNLEPVTGDTGGALNRVELSGGMVILSADNPDKAKYPTQAFKVRGAALPDILVGEVVWFARNVGSQKRR